ncbi:MAG: tRNA (adenosine(37)-N6)-threonylcarbamoyltransferase complex ATPase subunit type 1 TsaE [Solirubrobacterales bacterium]|nr:tRNA (adenosine(37)-N6)-threonylcarbamoyltransferase complex ATPase subunit type 1 TsaE [Solirubrobacterales bacterium]
MAMSRRQVTSSSEQTEALAAELAGRLEAGDVVLVEGELGAGKTTFVRGACRALGVEGLVTSPTFTIGQRYPGRVPVAHLDLYRVADLDAEDPELLSDYIGPDRVAFVEWAGGAAARIAGLAHVAARVLIEHAGGDSRTVTIFAPPELGLGPDGVPGPRDAARSAAPGS